MTDTSATIRPAEASDAEAIASLFTDEGYPAGPSDIVGRMSRFASPHSRVVIAEYEGAVLGFIALHALPRFEHDDRIVRVLALVVDAGARERGVGHQLMVEAERIAAELGAAFVEVTVGSSPAGGAPPVRIDGLRRIGRGLPAEEALTGAPPTESRVPAVFPRLRLRGGAAELLDLPWERPLGRLAGRDRRHDRRDALPGAADRSVAAPGPIPRRAGADLRAQGGAARRRSLGVRDPAPPATCWACRRSRPLGLAEAPERDTAILVTEYLAYSIQYRRLLMRFPLGPGPYRDRLLDAMAWLLVDLHRAGVFWGDCSLANTLFRRDGDKIQAFLVDAETSEIHPSLSDGQRAYDLDILVENVAFGLADLGAMQGREGAAEDAVEAAETVRARYAAMWDELHLEPELSSDDRHAVRARIRRLNDLGFAVDEITLEPSRGRRDVVRLQGGRREPPVPRPGARTADRHRGARGTGPPPAQRPARVPRRGSSTEERHAVDEVEVADRWLDDVLEPSLRELMPAIGRGRDPLQAYCDVLEEKWILSEAAGKDVGLAGGDGRLPAASARRRRRATARPATSRSRSTSTGRPGAIRRRARAGRDEQDA